MEQLERTIRACTLCKDEMDHSPRPVLQWGLRAPIAICGQAPGNLAHQSGRPFSDPSGDRLRSWLGVTEDQFYDPSLFAIIPMGFCFPGYDERGADRPPFKRCAAQWHGQIFSHFDQLQLIILVGGYAQQWHLGARRHKTLTQTLAHWSDYTPRYLPIPPPSWRNNAWLKRHEWFETTLLPYLKERVVQAIASTAVVQPVINPRENNKQHGDDD